MTMLNKIRERLNEVLTSADMALIKGGNSSVGDVSITLDTPVALKKVTKTASLNSDDKRRERPGGGISTL